MMSANDEQAVHIEAGAGDAVTIGSGLGVIFKVPGSATANSVSVVEHTLPPGALGAPPHRHQNEDETSYVLAGQLAVLQGDELTIAGPGSYVVKPRGIFHTFWNPGKEMVHFIEIISPGGFENYFRETAQLIPTRGPPDMDALFALAQRYGLEFDMSRIPELAQKYSVNLMIG